MGTLVAASHGTGGTGLGHQFSSDYAQALMVKLNRGGTNGPFVLGHSARGGGLADGSTGVWTGGAVCGTNAWFHNHSSETLDVLRRCRGPRSN